MGLYRTGLPELFLVFYGAPQNRSIGLAHIKHQRNVFGSADSDGPVSEDDRETTIQ